jgi:isoaspartyl peptidase/L-asparaginase-like protein (Ntn-hydrolase superfamily)
MSIRFRFSTPANPSSAAKAAMAILRTGGTALDAVEIAIKVLEDREITNAGYGSNLAIDGVVECDATIVDHFGRSGAVGAVSRLSSHHTTISPHRTDTMQRSKIQSRWPARFWTAAHSCSPCVGSLQIC